MNLPVAVISTPRTSAASSRRDPTIRMPPASLLLPASLIAIAMACFLGLPACSSVAMFLPIAERDLPETRSFLNRTPGYPLYFRVISPTPSSFRAVDISQTRQQRIAKGYCDDADDFTAFRERLAGAALDACPLYHGQFVAPRQQCQHIA